MPRLIGIRNMAAAAAVLCLGLILTACDGEKTAKVGEAAPELGVIDLDGNTVRLADFRGDVTVLNFWQGGCAPCLTEMPKIQAFHEKHRGDGVHVLSVNIGGGPAIIRDTVAETGVTFDVAFDEVFVASTRYKINFFPTTFLIDRNGIVRERIVGEIKPGQLEAKVAGLR
ncbi:TlpA family protein disulfide reductase [Rhodobium gokarnense]|uniref:Peroxiredoxin n=1 Tax=Rhodobium gokarnense TaxID=364296 RepID=A0ABT3HGQ7_9HYPH|nr:TlpA disulfide reductase family protein [Rhodobium gokarnense]MCW2309585.1 peroxiredoxin [Rhodobium gokarnense]